LDVGKVAIVSSKPISGIDQNRVLLTVDSGDCNQIGTGHSPDGQVASAFGPMTFMR
jgi:hypothetical protein